MQLNFNAIRGIGPLYLSKLTNVGIQTLHQLLERGASKQGRKAISEATKIKEEMILDWVHLADLVRIKGIDSQMAKLLHLAGVDTVRELSTRHPLNLFEKVVALNAEKHFLKHPPTLEKLEYCIDKARDLEPVVQV